MRTQRGFEVFTAFTDSHGSMVRVQESSSFERVWVFSERPKDTAVPLHLTPAQARRVAYALLRFADGRNWRDRVGGQKP